MALRIAATHLLAGAGFVAKDRGRCKEFGLLTRLLSSGSGANLDTASLYAYEIQAVRPFEARSS